MLKDFEDDTVNMVIRIAPTTGQIKTHPLFITQALIDGSKNNWVDGVNKKTTPHWGELGAILKNPNTITTKKTPLIKVTNKKKEVILEKKKL